MINRLAVITIMVMLWAAGYDTAAADRQCPSPPQAAHRLEGVL